MLYLTILRYVMQYFAMLRNVMRFYVVSLYIMSWANIGSSLSHLMAFCNAMLCFTMLCCTVPCCAGQCYATLCYATSCYVMPSFAMICLALLINVLSWVYPGSLFSHLGTSESQHRPSLSHLEAFLGSSSPIFEPS